MRKERMSSTTHAQGAGPCGGMYTANTVASVIGTMGMSLAYREAWVRGNLQEFGELVFS
jgi:dihydroxyacid dehydratase/phosphogluconate dehydratase